MAAALVAVVGAGSPAGETATARGTGHEAPITIAGYQPARAGSAIWDGGPARVRQVRFLQSARLAVVSPSGAGVAFIRYSGDGLDLFRTGVYAGFEARLAHVAGSRTTALAFSPDSRTIAFASPRGLQLTSIVYGRAPRALSLPARWRGSSFEALRFSPDGKLLAFSRTWGDGRAGRLRNELSVIRLDGGGARSLAVNSNPYSAQYRPSFSPDGTRIAFAAADGSIAVVPTAGGRVVRLTAPRPAGTRRTDLDPLFSPDGSTVAFTRVPGTGGSDAYVVGSDGSGLRRLTRTALPPRGEPRTGSTALAWSPDSRSLLAFRHDRLAIVPTERGGAETTLARIGVQYGLSSAVWHA